MASTDDAAKECGRAVEHCIDNPTRPAARATLPARGREKCGETPPLQAIDVEAVRRAYQSGEPVAAIGSRFGLNNYRLRKLRLDGGWAVRPRGLNRRGMASSEAMELKLDQLVASGIARLEKLITREGINEANARTLRELCRAQEIRMRMTRTNKPKPDEKKNNDGYDFRDDPAWLRAELARRLDRIRQTASGGAGGDPEVDGRRGPEEASR